MSAEAPSQEERHHPAYVMIQVFGAEVPKKDVLQSVGSVSYITGANPCNPVKCPGVPPIFLLYTGVREKQRERIAARDGTEGPVSHHCGCRQPGYPSLS